MSDKMIKNGIWILVIGLLSASPAMGGTYKWVDEDGNVVYSQHPPPEGQFESIQIKPTPGSGSSSNSAVEPATAQTLLATASRLVASELGKPESYVMVALEDNTPMLFAGDDAPLAYLELKSIGLPESRTAQLSAALCQLMEESIGVGKDRVYIEFADAPRKMWGWNGATF